MAFKSLMLVSIAVSALVGTSDSLAQQDVQDDHRDWVGMRRDLGYLVGWQVVATVIIYNAPFEFSNWSQDEKDNLGFEQWSKNVTDPVWDKDHWAVNYLLHPYWGAGYYIRGRERGFSRRESFWIAALYSTVYEFGIESFLEQPSIQDIIVTPVAGAAVGLYFENVRHRIRSKSGRLTFSDRMKLGLTDPLGALNRGVNRLFRIDETEKSQLVMGIRPVRAAPLPGELRQGRQVDFVGKDIDGFQMTFDYRW
jgi:hypothetical protein